MKFKNEVKLARVRMHRIDYFSQKIVFCEKFVRNNDVNELK